MSMVLWLKFSNRKNYLKYILNYNDWSEENLNKNEINHGSRKANYQ
jgi:hypothetical protein